METGALLPAGEALAEIVRLFDRVDSARGGLDAATRLEWVRLARVVHQRAGALASVLTGEADRAQASERVAGTPLASWLSRGETLSRREASGAVAQAKALVAHPDGSAPGRRVRSPGCSTAWRPNSMPPNRRLPNRC